MKIWSTHWKESVQRRKQRKYRYGSSLHTQRSFMGVHLSKELREKHTMRSLPVRVGDTVKVLRGRFKGDSGKVSRVEMKDLKVQIEGITLEKKDGSSTIPSFQPSNLIITALDESDKKRLQKGEKKNG